MIYLLYERGRTAPDFERRRARRNLNMTIETSSLSLRLPDQGMNVILRDTIFFFSYFGWFLVWAFVRGGRRAETWFLSRLRSFKLPLLPSSFLPPPLPQTHLSILAASSQVDLSHSTSVRCTRRTRSLRRVRRSRLSD